MSEAEKEVEAVAARKDSSEEIPAWADALMKSHADVMARLDSMDAGRKDSARKDAKDEGEDPTEDTDGKDRKDAADPKADAEDKDEKREDRKDAKGEDCADRKDETMEAADKSRKDAEKDREDRARKDSTLAAQNRAMAAKIAAMEHQIASLYSEPSIDDRNALADARSRADSVFQAALGRPVPEPLAGEKPIAYRRRLASALQKFSDSFKAEKLDGLAGPVFDTVENTIFADALAASKTEAVMPRGQLRAIRTRESGHDVTKYVGDQTVTWAPFSFGAGATVKMNRGLAAQ